MIGNSSVLSAALTVVSVVSLSLLGLFCLRCKKKSKVIHEEHQIYNPETFQRGGSRFAVTRSKTVTRANPIPTTTVESQDSYEEFPQDADDDDYQNVTKDSASATTGHVEHTYVAPLPVTVYENERRGERTTDTTLTPDVYINIELSSTKDDDDDYENSEFLKEQEDDEPDYVNENGT
uniref:linker for activation of T-cells family member 2 n=1 Tax=Semicossyphus pulcher TaxID=241346 RepID=UPI0037E77527